MSEDNKNDLNAAHPDYPGLTYGDVEKAKEKARKKLEAEKRTEMLERITEEEEAAMRAAMGETERSLHELATLKGGAKEMVEITLNLCPTMTDLRIDGVIYKNRGTYSVTRAKAQDMMKMQFDGWHAESARLGEDNYAFYSRMAQQKNSIVTRAGLLSSVVISGRTGAVTQGAAPRGTH